MGGWVSDVLYGKKEHAACVWSSFHHLPKRHTARLLPPPPSFCFANPNINKTRKKGTHSLTHLLGGGVALEPGDGTPLRDEGPHDETHVGMGEAIEHGLGFEQLHVEDGVHGA